MNAKRTANGTLRAVVIGVGGQGLRRAQAIRMTEGWHLVGVHDANPSLAASSAARLRCRAIPDPVEAVTCPSADVVVVAAPPFAHDAIIAEALGSFKHVLCEKPLTIRSESAARLAMEADRRGLVLATGFNHRFYGPVRDAISLIRSNRLGSIRRIVGRIGHPPAESTLDGWLGDVGRSGGGVLIDNGSHLIDMARLFLGDLSVASVQESHWHPSRPGIETHLRFRLESSSGASADLESTWRDADGPYLAMEILFERGVARLSAFPWRLEATGESIRTVTRRYWVDRVTMKAFGSKAPGLEASLIRELRALHDRVLSKRSCDDVPIATGADGHAAAAIVESIRQRIRPSFVPAPHFALRKPERVVR